MPGICYDDGSRSQKEIGHDRQDDISIPCSWGMASDDANNGSDDVAH